MPIHQTKLIKEMKDNGITDEKLNHIFFHTNILSREEVVIVFTRLRLGEPFTNIYVSSFRGVDYVRTMYYRALKKIIKELKILNRRQIT